MCLSCAFCSTRFLLCHNVWLRLRSSFGRQWHKEGGTEHDKGLQKQWEPQQQQQQNTRENNCNCMDVYTMGAKSSLATKDAACRMKLEYVELIHGHQDRWIAGIGKLDANYANATSAEQMTGNSSRQQIPLSPQNEFKATIIRHFTSQTPQTRGSSKIEKKKKPWNFCAKPFSCPTNACKMKKLKKAIEFVELAY